MNHLQLVVNAHRVVDVAGCHLQLAAVWVRTVRTISVAFRSAKAAFLRAFRGAKGDYTTVISRPLLSRRHLAVAVFLLVCAGCGGGPAEYEVTGTVTYKDNLIPTGSVTYAPQGGGQLIVTAIAEDGTYKLQAPIGTYEVGIAAIGEVAEGREGFEQRTPQPLLPGRFSYPSRSGVVVTVEEKDDNLIDLSLR